MSNFKNGYEVIARVAQLKHEALVEMEKNGKGNTKAARDLRQWLECAKKDGIGTGE